MLIFVLGAAAHSPHDVCSAAARAEDGTLLVGEGDDLARYNADGTLAAHLPSPGGAPVCLAALGASWVLVTDTGVWRSDDDGAAWGRLAAAALDCAEGAAGVWVGGGDGIWWIPESGELERVATAPVFAVAEGPDGVLALDIAGALVDATTTLDEGPWTALAGGTDVLLGDAMGVVVWEGGLARPTVSGPTNVLELATGAVWLAAGPAGGVWVSEDSGGTWEERIAGLEETSTGAGSPPDGVHWSALIAEEPWVAASWEGLYVYDGRWVQRELRTSPLVRSLQWQGDRLLIAPYGAGIAVGTPGGDDWVDAAPSLDWPWLRVVLATEDGAGRWWAVGGKHVYVSDDAGGSWAVVFPELSQSGDVVAVAPGWPTDARVWSAGVDVDGVAVLASSDDGGDTWSFTTLAGCRDKPSALAVGDGVRVVCEGALYDGGGTRVVADGVTVVLADGDDWIMGGDAGLWRLGEDTLLLEGKVRDAVADEDGWIVATDAGLVRVGASVERLGWPTDDLVESLAAQDGRLAAGTFGGAWVSADGGRTWALAVDHDRYDDRDATWNYEGFSSIDDEDAKAGTAVDGAAGAVAEWRLEGTAFAIAGNGDATLDVGIDGEFEVVEVRGRAWHTIWSRAAEPGLHTVRIEVVEGRLGLDGGERWRAEGAVPWAVEVPPSDEPPTPCGCGSGAAWIGVVGGWLRRRRRTSRQQRYMSDPAYRKQRASAYAPSFENGRCKQDLIDLQGSSNPAGRSPGG